MSNPFDQEPRVKLITTAQHLTSIGRITDEMISDLSLALRMHETGAQETASPPKRT